MEVNGTVKQILPLESGISKAGKEWQKQTIVIDTGKEFNNIVAITAFGEEKIQSLNKLQEGMTAAILCNVHSREYNGKYYHNIDGYHFTQQSEKTGDDFVTSDEVPF